LSGTLALYGGKPVRGKILPFEPEEADIGPAEIHAAVRVLKSNKLSQLSGEEVANFEKEFAEYYDVRNAIATSSGTTALHAALAGLGIGPGETTTRIQRSRSGNHQYIPKRTENNLEQCKARTLRDGHRSGPTNRIKERRTLRISPREVELGKL
jgi:hypothetical protein